MKKILLLFISVILICSIYSFNIDKARADPQVTYYVADDGDDSNDGLSPSSPWRTKAKVHNELKAGGCINDGDDILFKRGDSFTANAPIGLYSTDGTVSNPMVFGAYGSGPDPILSRGMGATHGIFQVGANNIGYWIFENLNFSNSGSHGFQFYSYGNINNFIIRNCTFYNLGGGASFYYSHYVTIENCTFIKAVGGFLGSSSNGCSNTIVKDCFIDAQNSFQDGWQLHFTSNEGNNVGSNHYMYNVTSINCNEDSFDLVGGIGCNNIYLKDCSGDSGIVVGHDVSNVVIEGYKGYSIYFTESQNTIVRNSIFRRNYDNIGQDDPQYWNGVGTKNVIIYNNDIIQTGSNNFIQINNGNRNDIYLDTFVVKNNIFYSTSYSSPTEFVNYISMGAGNWNLSNTNSEYFNNIWWRGDGNMNIDHWSDEDGSYNLVEWNALDDVYNDIGVDPEFVDVGNEDYSLESTSPAIDAGSWLTSCDGGGSGSTINVHESNYFFAGLPTLGVPGDNIFIGDDADLEIVSVDYDAETITVDQSISWSDGDAVSLSSFGGSGPDIGAFESGFSSPESYYPEISNIVLAESDPLDTDSSFGWINITSEVFAESGLSDVRLIVNKPDSSNVNVSMIDAGSNNYYYFSNSLFSNYGDYSYYVWAIDLNGNQSSSGVIDFAMPPNWDINGDGVCNVADLTLISNNYNLTGSNGWIREDVDNNGIIQVLDLVQVSFYYDQTW